MNESRIKEDANKCLYISDNVKVGDHASYLINNTYEKVYHLLIKDDVNNELKHNYRLTFKDINNLSETDELLLTGIIEPLKDEYEDTWDILYNLIDNLNEKTKCKIDYHQDIDDELILNWVSELENKITINKEQIENEKQVNLIQSIMADISLILNKVNGTDEFGNPLNPKRLNKGDLAEYLAKYLSLKYGLILRSNVNTPHLLNKGNNCYELTNNEEILSLIANDFGHNTISMKDTKKALDYIDNRPKPNYNIIRFNNCIYDMKKHDMIKLDNPTLPYFDIYFNYNQNAKGELIQQFLYSSLEDENKVKGLLELIGYLFTVGNKENIIICFIGKGGSGKSVLSNILRHLFKRVSNLPIHNLNKDHDLMSLENNLLNICNDTDNKKIKDNGTFKQITGGDSVYINPKYRDPYVMPPEEVPYFIIVGNHFPQFENLEIPIIERLMLVEFKKGFRNTDNQNKNLFDDIIENDDNIEWLIHSSLEAYKDIVINNKSFTLKKSTNENLDLYNKHSNPLKWIVKKLIVFDDSYIPTSDINEYDLTNYITCYISVDELKQSILTFANNEGLDIGLTDNNNLSTNRLTNSIKSAFNLWALNDSIGYDYKPIQKQEHNKRSMVYPNIKFKGDHKI